MDNVKLNGVDVFPDIKYTFDFINHTILLNKTNQRLGFIDIEVEWFESHMTKFNRGKQCIVNDQLPPKKMSTCGVKFAELMKCALKNLREKESRNMTSIVT